MARDYPPRPGWDFPGEPPREALDWFEAKGLKPSFDHRDVWREEHVHAFTVAKMMEADLLAWVQKDTARAMREGMTYQQWRRGLEPRLREAGWWGIQERMDPKTGELRPVQLGSPWRLRVIYDTNMRMARAAGQWQRAVESRETHPYLVYGLGPSIRHRKLHEAWDGLMYPLDDPFWQTHMPPNGWLCKCHVRQVSRVEAKRRGMTPSAPLETVYRDWTNERTGKVERVPVGIDPGFDYNPGVSRTKHLAKVAGEKLAALAEPIRVALEAQGPAKPVTAKELGKWLGREARREEVAFWNRQIKLSPERVVSGLVGAVDQQRPGLLKAARIRILEQVEPKEPMVDISVKFGSVEVNRLLYFEEGRLTVIHQLLDLGDLKNRGLGAEVTRDALRLYRELGVSNIVLKASMTEGGYVWARYGFVPSQSAWDKVRGQIRERLAEMDLDGALRQEITSHLDDKNPRAIWRVADSVLGKELLLGRSWDGEMDLGDQVSVRRTRDYLRRRGYEP